MTHITDIHRFFLSIKTLRKKGSKLHNEDLINLSKARIEHAKDCLKESEILLSADEYKGASNRAYYAAFHAMRAMLISDEFDSKKHSGIIAKFRECI